MRSTLARQVSLADAWEQSEHSDICCLIYATQNGWKLPILLNQRMQRIKRFFSGR